MSIHTARSRRLLGPRRGAALALAAVAVAGAPSGGVAQMPGLPVLQDGFVSHGWSVAANGGTEEGASTFGVAAAWTPASARFQFSVGVGALRPDGGGGTSLNGGLRLAVPVVTPWTGRATSALGLAVFGGVGGARREQAGVVYVPVGVGVGYRRRLGGERAVAAFVTPFFNWARRTGEVPAPAGEAGSDGSQDSNLFRTSLGIDAVLTSRLGASVGYELGAKADAGRPGPTGGVFGLGLSYRF
jgi:hypothetical protein